MTLWRGQDRAIADLLGAIDADRLHHAWLLGGPMGVGKGGIARAVAKLLLGAGQGRAAGGGLPDLPSDDPVVRLVDAGTHPDLVVLERLVKEKKKGDEPSLARNITVDQIRGLSQFLHLAPSMASRRVVIIDSADELERGAANALLKNLEEPPRGTIFLLVSHAPGRLLPTIRSRCRFLNFQPLPDEDMAAALADAAPELSAEARAALIRGAGGSPGRALAMQALDIPALEAALTRIAQSGDPLNKERIALARALSPKAAQPRYEAFLDYVPHFIARRVRTHRDGVATTGTDAWAEAVALGRGAIAPLQLDPAATIFALCGAVARLAPEKV
jgi:DNA polymerase-3 subunit delta'